MCDHSLKFLKLSFSLYSPLSVLLRDYNFTYIMIRKEKWMLDGYYSIQSFFLHFLSSRYCVWRQVVLCCSLFGTVVLRLIWLIVVKVMFGFCYSQGTLRKSHGLRLVPTMLWSPYGCLHWQGQGCCSLQGTIKWNFGSSCSITWNYWMHQTASHFTGEFIKLLTQSSKKLQTEFPCTFLFSEKNSSGSSSSSSMSSTGGRGEAACPAAVQDPRGPAALPVWPLQAGRLQAAHLRRRHRRACPGA
jgi:hypothetical protein